MSYTVKVLVVVPYLSLSVESNVSSRHHCIKALARSEVSHVKVCCFPRAPSCSEERIQNIYTRLYCTLLYICYRWMTIIEEHVFLICTNCHTTHVQYMHIHMHDRKQKLHHLSLLDNSKNVDWLVITWSKHNNVSSEK